jgi:predicted Zn-dependent protease
MRNPARQTRHALRAGRRYAAALACATVAGCSVNPATGQKELNLVSESQEVAMGLQAAKDVALTTGTYQDSAWQGYVSQLGKQLAAKSERPQLPWTFTVVDDPEVNAFALPGGYIFVTRGILANMNSEAELAGVIGHEIGHVTARHSATQMSRAQLAQLGLGLGVVLRPELAQYAGAATQGLQLLFLKYTRDDETQADMLGFRYSVRGGYDPHAMLDLFTMLEGVESMSGQGRLPGWATTHPFPENRLAHVQRMLDSAKADYGTLRRDRPSYQQRLEGMVYGDDPRQGYFDGQAFYHPELRFQAVFPDGWQTNNGFTAVTGLTQQQDGLLQLGFGSKDPPMTQLTAFLQQDSVHAGATSRAPVNGLPAASAQFTARLAQGPVQGYVAFVQYGSNVYRLMALSTAGRAAAYDQAMRNWIGSFRPLTDPARLGVQPMRIHLVRLSGAMRLAAFNTRYPSVVPIGRVALINGVPEDGTLPAGLAKQVVRR